MVDWNVYAEIQNYKRRRFKKGQVAKKLNIHRQTVAKYWDMTPDEYAAIKGKHRKRKADAYKSLIIEWLLEYPDMTAAQIYDWCKERSPLETLSFQKRAFQDYVNSLRKEYDIKKPEKARQYEASDERAPGEQGQVDMGEIYVPTQNGRNKKVYCFAMVLSHSRYKYVLWQERPFTTDTFIQAHIKAFDFLGGRPKEIVYDQDKVLAVSENNGDIIYTEGFQNYLNVAKFSIRLCRGADPESKGMVENVVKFAKHGFAEHRTFIDIDSFNDDCIAWLRRTANHDKHGTTQQRPDEVFAKEKEYLIPVSEYSFTPNNNKSISYSVRKDNIVLYKSNRYRVPVGTYHKGLRVLMVVDEEKDEVAITDEQSGKVYARHTVCHERGKLIGVSERSERDKSKSVIEQEKIITNIFDNSTLVENFLKQLHNHKRRYYRDQLGVIKKLFENWSKEEILKGIEYCNEKEFYSAGELKSIVAYFSQTSPNTVNRENTGKSACQLPKKYRGDKPSVRSLAVYETAMSGGDSTNG